MGNRFRSIINVVLFCLVLFVNHLANALPINGVTQKEISAEYAISLTPSGYVFAIWGIIYLGLVAYVVRQALPKSVSAPGLRSLDLPFALSCIFNASWLVVWHYRHLTVSVVLMLGLLGSLVMAYHRIRVVQRSRVENFPWFVHRTFSVYLGWVGLATILNVSIWLDSLGWTGAPLSAASWGGVMLGVACGLYAYLGFSQRDFAVPAVLAWASLGIGLKNQAESLIWITGLTVCAVSLIFTVVIIVLDRSTRRPSVQGSA